MHGLLPNGISSNSIIPWRRKAINVGQSVNIALQKSVNSLKVFWASALVITNNSVGECFNWAQVCFKCVRLTEQNEVIHELAPAFPYTVGDWYGLFFHTDCTISGYDSVVNSYFIRKLARKKKCTKCLSLWNIICCRECCLSRIQIRLALCAVSVLLFCFSSLTNIVSVKWIVKNVRTNQLSFETKNDCDNDNANQSHELFFNHIIIYGSRTQRTYLLKRICTMNKYPRLQTYWLAIIETHKERIWWHHGNAFRWFLFFTSLFTLLFCIVFSCVVYTICRINIVL